MSLSFSLLSSCCRFPSSLLWDSARLLRSWQCLQPRSSTGRPWHDFLMAAFTTLFQRLGDRCTCWGAATLQGGRVQVLSSTLRRYLTNPNPEFCLQCFWKHIVLKGFELKLEYCCKFVLHSDKVSNLFACIVCIGWSCGNGICLFLLTCRKTAG